MPIAKKIKIKGGKRGGRLQIVEMKYKKHHKICKKETWIYTILWSAIHYEGLLRK